MGQYKRNRPDKDGAHRVQFDANKKKIYATCRTCGICGKPVDFSIKYPDPWSACIDHIIPVDKGGHPSDIDNLQLAHMACNRAKSDKLFRKEKLHTEPMEKNRTLPLSREWAKYKAN